MDSPFIFSREVVNDAFAGRREELSWLTSNLSNRENTVLIAPAGYGKKSLVRNAFIQAKKQTEFKLCTCHLFNVRDEYAFYTSLTHELLSAACATADEWTAVADQLLPLSQPQVTVNERKSNTIQILFDRQRLLQHANETLLLPERLAERQNTPFIVWINDFQQIADFDNAADFQKRLLAQWKHHHRAGYVLCGDKVNAMNRLFAEGRPFYNFAEQIPLEPVEEKPFVEYIIRSFSKSGRVIAREFAETIWRTTRGYPFYTQQFAHLCWVNTQGFVNDSMMDGATTDLINHNDRFFRSLVDTLTTPQINYLRAIIDGIDRFSAAEVILRYGLNSSANITRVRGALENKEVIHCVRNKPRFIDPVFELWMKKRYFDAE
ncbi:MAG: hypothetical protein LBS12_01110 [Prevotellaceae bacterium]|jgi:hypothetical protein|nr:hypothetical protein [Prevotellaceae bacterium]